MSITRRHLVASSFFALLGAACTASPDDDGGSAEQEKRIRPQGSGGEAALVIEAPANVPAGFPLLTSLKPRYSAGTKSGPLTLGEPKTIPAGQVCVTIDKTERTWCANAAAGSTVLVTLATLEVQIDDAPDAKTLLGPTEVRPAIVIGNSGVTPGANYPYGSYFAYDGQSGGASSGKRFVLPGTYVAQYVDGTIDTRTVAPGENAVWHPRLLERGSVRVDFEQAELPTTTDELSKVTLAWVPEPTKALAMGEYDAYVQPALDASDTNWALLAGYPRVTNEPTGTIERVEVTPKKNVVAVLPGARKGGRYFLVAGNKAIEVKPERGSETVIPMPRLDVSDPEVDVTTPSGSSKRAVKGTFAVYRKTSGGEKALGTPWVETVGNVWYTKRSVGADRMPTGSGLPLLPGDYRVEVRYRFNDVEETKSYDVSLP